MKKLLIAEHCEVMAEELEKALAGQWDVHVCHDGYAAVDAVESLRPDALIIDLGLPKKSGFGVLAECFPNLPPVIIALSAVVNPFVEQYAARWGVDYLFQIPFDMDLLVSCMGSVTQFQEIATKRVAQHLRVLGISAKLTGYYCLLLAIPLLKEDLSQHLHKEVYSWVAAALRMDPRAVEKAIRTAIQSAWRQRSPQTWAHYFPTNGDGEVECPKNKEFVVSLAMKI